MPGDASDAQSARDQEFVRWLRALADAVERDPALAERVRTEAVTGAQADQANEQGRKHEGHEDSHETHETGAFQPEGVRHSAPGGLAPGGCAEHTLSSPDSITPTLRHTRRSSRYGPPSVSGRAVELGTGVPDPFALYAAAGEDGLRRALETLRVGSLRAIIRAHGLDPQGKLSASATEKRLIAVIVTAAKRAAGTGEQRTTKRTTTRRTKTPEAS